MNIKKDLSCVILSKNEEKNIERAIKSSTFCDEIIVIDDYSTDKTASIAKELGAIVFQRKLENDFATQRNCAMEKTKGEWVLFIDADEEVTAELRCEIITITSKSFAKRQKDQSQKLVVAYQMGRRDIFWGREVRHGEVRQMRFIRLMKKESGTWKGAVHEQFHTHLKTSSLKNFLLHYPHQSIDEFLSEVNRYSSIRADELYVLGKTSSIISIIFYPFGKFIVNFFFRLGFLDGPSGFVYAFMMSFHSFLVRAKLFLIQHKK
ncbi:MAG TPA: glycosyltransferase family 2 protein [Patescibacteria group bacterium]|nr:glycosyltransferase family 2 protein [Patescibacteria group bacterium]